MPVRGIRGATVAAADTPEAIRAATRELMLALIEANGLVAEDIASVIFTLTPDLTAQELDCVQRWANGLVGIKGF